MKYTIKLLYVRFFGYCGYVNKDNILVWKTIKMLRTDMCKPSSSPNFIKKKQNYSKVIQCNDRR